MCVLSWKKIDSTRMIIESSFYMHVNQLLTMYMHVMTTSVVYTVHAK